MTPPRTPFGGLTLALLLSACRAVPEPPRGESTPATSSPAAATTAEHAASGSQDGTIAWEDPDAAFERAAREGKPVVVVLTATWCGHCRTYQREVLTDPAVVAASSDFVMVHVDIDQRPDLNRRFAIDGTYVPRTLFFEPGGQHRAELHAARPNYLYFLQTGNPGELLSLMRRAAG